MKKEHASANKRAFVVHPIVVSALAAFATVSMAVLAAWNLHLDRHIGFLDEALAGTLSLVAARVAMQCGGKAQRRLVMAVGTFGMALCVALCAWVFHTSNFQLTANSYPDLNAANVPADLIAELKNAEGLAAETEQQFVANLDSQFGPDHIAPYRDALVQSGWNIHRRTALGAMLGFGVCFSLTIGASLALWMKTPQEVALTAP